MCRETKLYSDRKSIDKTSSRKVFVVHGHNEVVLHRCIRFLERLQFVPVVLNELPGRTCTIIEKLEDHFDALFAVVLFTSDDVGRASSDEGKMQGRARQNVVLELGYFLAKLGRSKVALLLDDNVEIPSDLHGVEYIKLDSGRAWQLRLAGELGAAGLSVNLNQLLTD